MTTAQEPQLDAGAIRRDYLDGLNAMDDAGGEELRERLAEHVRGLVPAVRGRIPHMGARSRAQADHCLTRAAETLAASPAVVGAGSHTYALAVSARALLALYRRSWPTE